MGKTVTRDWNIDPVRRGLVLSMQVEVNGRLLRQTMRLEDEPCRFGGPPPAFIEREMRAKLMKAVERELFGEP